VDTPTSLPAVFVGHGSPMNALETNRWTSAWRAFGESIPRPRAILAVSAHWYVNATAVTAMERPTTIHDFYGFPPELFALGYPAPGDPELAGRVIELLDPTWVGSDVDSWGIDHGTWSVLVHMFPDADIPVVQLSIDATKPAEYHVQVGAGLAPLRREGVLVLGSGNVVHNLRLVEWDQPEGATDWNVEFDTAATALMAERPGDIAELTAHRYHSLAAPTPDHLLPLFYVAGVAAADGVQAETLVEGYAMGSLSMTGYVVPPVAG
jgi:4,5-DOPA dioxygenase extradiol